MRISQKVQKILKNYEYETPAVKQNIARILSHGKLAGTGRMIIYPVDQGFEHGAGRSFAMNPAAYDPHYHYQLAIDAGVNAYAAPLGALECGIDTFFGRIPLVLKLNSSNSLYTGTPDQAMTASVEDAVRLGCVAVGFTIYPGSDNSLMMIEQASEIIAEAKSYGLASIIWAYPRGSISKEGETALDTIAYGAHIISQLGGHIIKVKFPSDFIENNEAKKVYEVQNVMRSTGADRIRHVVESCFNGRRLVVFSGGEGKSLKDVYQDTRDIHLGGGNGSIIGRNCFKRPRYEALNMIKEMIAIYKTA